MATGGEVLHQLGAVDRAVYQAIASVPTPALDRAARRLSNSANNSRLWLGIAAALALTGPSGRRAAVRGREAPRTGNGFTEQGGQIRTFCCPARTCHPLAFRKYRIPGVVIMRGRS